MELQVVDLQNKKTGDITLDDAIFGIDANTDVMTQMVKYQLANRRQGSHKVLDKSEVSGTGKKPFKQKGTGNTRQGTKRSPQMRTGGVAHGPVVRDHDLDMPKKMRRLALKSALSSKAKAGQLIVIDTLEVKDSKTKTLSTALSKMNVKSALFIDGQDIADSFALAIRNIPLMDVLPSQGANVYDILQHDTLILSKAGVEALQTRLSA